MGETLIRQFREAAGLTLEDLASEAGISVSQLSRIERDEREPRLDELQKIGVRLNIPVSSLIGETEKRRVAVVGRIGAGGTIDTSSEQIDEAEPLYELELSSIIEEEPIAFEVLGPSMYPRYEDGDVIVCSRIGIQIERLVGDEAAVLTDEGARFLKKVVAGSRRGLYNLESHNADVIRDVRITWASPVGTVVRRNQVKRLRGAGATNRAVSRSSRAGAESAPPAIADRMRRLREALGFATPELFADSLNIYGDVWRQIEMTGVIDSATVESIVQRYPDATAEWIYLGLTSGLGSRLTGVLGDAGGHATTRVS